MGNYKMTSEYKTLSDVQQFLNNIPNINNGGCGVVALSMYRWLKVNNLLSNTKFVFLYETWNKNVYLNNKSVLKNNKGNPEAPAHICILHDAEFLGSLGRVDVSNYRWVQIIEEETFIKDTLNNFETWNDEFRRETFIKNIEEKLVIDLSDILKRSSYLTTKEKQDEEKSND